MKVYRHEQSPEEKKKSKRGKAARRKGHDFERELVRKFNEELKDFHAERGLQSKGGRGRADIRLTGPFHEFHCECKRGIAPNIRAAYIQAVRDHKFGSIAVAITKASKGYIDPIVTMYLDDFIAILQALEGSQVSGVVKVIAPPGIRIDAETRD